MSKTVSNKNDSSANPLPLILAAIGALGVMAGIVWFYGKGLDIDSSIRHKVVSVKSNNDNTSHPTETVNQDAQAPTAANEQIKEDKRGAVRKFIDELNGKENPKPK